MNITSTIRHSRNIVFSTILSAGIVTSAYAAPGALSDTPLFLANAPQPNIFFMLDDSGSMDFELMVNNSVYGGLQGTNPRDDYYVLPSLNNNYSSIDTSAACTASGSIGCYNVVAPPDAVLPNDIWRVRNHNYNAIYYNPAITYEPWDGIDTNGLPLYADATPTAALVDPGNPSQGTLDLTSNVTYMETSWSWSWGCWCWVPTRTPRTIFPAHYYIWTDNANGIVDGTDTHTLVQIIPTVTSYTGSANRTDCASAPTCTYAEEIQNFANWYSYHRKREYVAKYAVSGLINNSQARVGMSTIHNNNSVGTVIRDVDDISTPMDATARANKVNLLRQLANINSSSGTPLLDGLRNVGNYYEGVSTGVSSLFGTGQPSPILSSSEGGQCQQNFTILMSDGFWNSGNPNIGDRDADGAGIYDGASYADGTSHTLADIAMHYYERDLSSLADKVPVTDVDVEASNAGYNYMHQHMVTYAVAFGISGNASCNPPQRTTSVVSQAWPEICTNASATVGTGWPDPTDTEDLDRVDDMRHAAWNGRGEFLSASNPQDLVDAMTQAIEDIDDRTGSAAAASFNSTSLRTDTLVFQARFDSAGWHGDLYAYNLIQSANGTVSLGGIAWKAGELIDVKSASSRQIATYNGTSGITFETPSDYRSPSTSELSAAQISDLMANAPHSISTTDATEITENQEYLEDIVEYLRGDDTNEGSSTGDFRDRGGHKLGDIVHSGPFYVGAPATPYPNEIEGASHPYNAFMNTWSSRPGRVYVGSNDGMLHVFDASTGSNAGQEVFAYIPGFLFSDDAGDGLHHQAEQGYVHDYQVDLSPIAADVFISSGWGSSGWKTALVGGVRGGGKGVFVLDITDPSDLTAANAANVVKLEFTDSNLGYTFSDIQVGKMNNGKWAAIFGNGYNSTGDGGAKLFILYLDGSGHVVFNTNDGASISGGDCTDSGSNCNGLSSPALADLNGDGTIDRVYAGDLFGNMWAFNVSASSLASSATVSQPLFIACEGNSGCTVASGDRQPITSAPALSRHPTIRDVDTYPNIMVYFGTGQFLVDNDINTTQPQEFYGVWDRDDRNINSSDLVLQTFTNTSATTSSGVRDARTVTSNTVNYDAGATTDYGWRIELSDSKERNVVNAAVVGDIVFFNSMVPETGACEAGGYSWLTAVHKDTGGEPPFTVLDLNNDGLFDSSDQTGGDEVAAIKTDGITTDSRFLDAGNGRLIRVTSGSTGIDITGVQTGEYAGDGRMSWSILE